MHLTTTTSRKKKSAAKFVNWRWRDEILAFALIAKSGLQQTNPEEEEQVAHTN